VNTLAVEGKLRPVNPATLEPAQSSWARASFDDRRGLVHLAKRYVR
jgi:hypothetical protein